MVGEGLAWISEAYREGYGLVFARGLTAVELLARMGLDPFVPADDAAERIADVLDAQADELRRADGMLMLTADEAGLIGMQDDEDGVPLGRYPIRAGTHGGWAYAVELFGLSDVDAALKASVGTEAVSLTRTGNALCWFSYAADGVVLCSFDAGMPGHRSGTDPDCLGRQMFEVGLSPDTAAAPDPEGAMLALAEQAFGLRLPTSEVENEPLVTAWVRE